MESIEGKKQNFKENNNLTDIKSDADLTITQQYNYDSELFDAESQMDLINLFEKSYQMKVSNYYQLILD